MSVTRAGILGWMSEKQNIEAAIEELYHVLIANNVGMRDALVDGEGYPRNDIDVYQVRHARHKIKRLQNDHKAAMKKIEAGLIELHSGYLNGPMGTLAPPPTSHLSPFVYTDQVEVGSPAHLGGLKPNDHICKFGSIVAENFRSLGNIGEVVQNSKKQAIVVVVRRGETDVTLSITPKQWSGKGLLGCNLLTFDTPER